MTHYVHLVYNASYIVSYFLGHMATKQTYRVAVDSGNHSIKTMMPGSEPRSIRAIKARVNPGMPLQRATEDSPVIVTTTPEVSVTHLGRNAQRYSLVTPTVISDKLDEVNVKDAVLACLGPIEGSTSYTVDLAFSVPSVDRVYHGLAVTDYLHQVLAGTHKYKHNGADMSVVIRSVTVVREADAALQVCSEAGLVSDTGDTLLIDVGGGTVNASLFSPDHYLVDAVTLDGYGCVRLANMLAESQTLRSAISGVEVHKLMDGIADGTFCYGRSKVSFDAELQKVLPDWWALIKGTILNALSSKVDYLETIILNGGTSILLQPMLKGNPTIVFSPDPVTSVVRGLLTYI